MGGKVKTALYYDISLLLISVKVQPDGTVTVKIRIPDGVSPEKCKVYHVTDDPVDPLVKFTSSLDGDYIVFETDHFSEFAVLEVETVPEGIVITSPPDKTVYNKGEAFDPGGMVITAFYSNGTNAVVTDYDVSVDTSVAGTVPLVVFYTFNGVTKSVSTVLTVKEPVPDTPVLPEIKLNVPKDAVVDYRTKITVTASASNLPDDYTLILRTCGKDVASGHGAVSYFAGEAKTGQTFEVRVADSSGNTVSDSDGKPLTAKFTVSVNNSFFARIVAFFKGLFNILPEIIIEP